MSAEDKPVNLWERGGKSPEAYKDSPDARRDKPHIPKLFNASPGNNMVFTGRVSFATGSNGHMAVNIDDPMPPPQQFGFEGYPWIAYAIDDPSTPSNGYDVALGDLAAGGSGTAQPITKLNLQVENPNDATAAQLQLISGEALSYLKFKGNQSGTIQSTLSCSQGASGISSLGLQAASNGIQMSVQAGNTSSVITLNNASLGSNISIDTNDLGVRNAKFILIQDMSGSYFLVLGAPQ